MRTRLGILALCATTVALGAGAAGAARLDNGGFERGFNGWDVREFGPASWNVVCALPRGFSFSAPPEGFCAAVSDQGEVSAQVLSQVVALQENRRHRLSYRLAWDNTDAVGPRMGPAPPPNGFITPNTLSLTGPNQQFRVDVMKASAPIRSTDPDDVLMKLSRPGPDDPAASDWERTGANLTQFAGRKVRLRFAVAVTEGPLHLGVDAVKIKSRRK